MFDLMKSSSILMASIFLASWMTAACSSDGDMSSETNVQDVRADLTLTEDISIDVGDALEQTTTLEYSDEVLELSTELKLEGNVTWLGIAGSTIIARVDNIWKRVDGKQVVDLVLPEGIEDMSLIDIGRLNTNDILMLSDQGLYVVQGSNVVSSPLDELLDDLSVHALETLTTANGTIVYFVTDAGLKRWFQGELQSLDLGELKTTNAMLSSHETTLWVASETDLYRLEEGEETLQAWPEPSQGLVTYLGADKHGNVWLEAAEEILLRHTDGTWENMTQTSEITRVTCQPDSETTWLWGKNSLLQVQANTARAVTDVPQGSLWVVDENGALLGATEEGLTRASGGRQVGLDGWQVDGVLLSLTTFQLQLEDSSQIDKVTVLVDKTPVDVDEMGTFSLDPTLFSAGMHNLSITVSYNDTNLDATLNQDFEVVVLSWQEDIFPIYKTHCGGCHGETGNVALKLYTAEHWEKAFDSVLPSVESGFMPPPYTLDEGELNTIRWWALANFPP